MDDTTILTISLTDEGKQYRITVPSGVSVNEVMFGVAVAIKCFVRDKVIDKPEIATDMLTRYLTDEQFAEVQDNQ